MSGPITQNRGAAWRALRQSWAWAVVEQAVGELPRLGAKALIAQHEQLGARVEDFAQDRRRFAANQAAQRRASGQAPREWRHPGPAVRVCVGWSTRTVTSFAPCAVMMRSGTSSW